MHDTAASLQEGGRLGRSVKCVVATHGALIEAFGEVVYAEAPTAEWDNP